jgi:hypothetical protein
MVGAFSFAPPTDATRAGIPLAAGAAAVELGSARAGRVEIVAPGARDTPLGVGPAAIETSGVGAAPLGGGPAAIEGLAAGGAPVVKGVLVDAIGNPAAGDLASFNVFELSGLDEVSSVVFELKPINLRHVVPSAKYMPIAPPTSTATMSPTMVTNHPGLQGRKREIAGSSD